ncbi:hypothetical protein PB1A_0547 [Leuconostoc inhae]|uniref:Uncharacterized protein n=2 Tax=Leuconostoc TaxID=1243 RepID=A0AAN2QWC9_9LACO|nr:hypothetical protein LEGAS_1847 [Leuconostoc gasicomitatum LMG 18811]CUW13446.1 hypothetical protein C122C_1064 [Leuconostoc gasicomitatum]CUW13864.1 hypothetical protein PB1A_0547 [Leuconostoc inhae]CUW15730.1 hypothetical protein PL111_1738 [Leuconostoc inhae]CUW17453.1 hypothetical protein C120C_1190 [Leuconostoc inhae]
MTGVNSVIIFYQSVSRDPTHAIPLSKIFLKKPRTHIVRGFFVKEYYIMFITVQLFQLIY